MSHLQQIDKHLASGKSLTAKEALDLFGCFRLAARIDELKHKGRNIVSIPVDVRTRNGVARVAKYRLSTVRDRVKPKRSPAALKPGDGVKWLEQELKALRGAK